jgi:hypothetical protein
MNQNVRRATIASPIITAATATPAVAPVLSPGELCNTVTVPVADAAAAVVAIEGEVEVEEDKVDVEDVEDKVDDKDVNEDEAKILLELGAADDVPGKSLSAIAWKVASCRGFWQLTVLSGYPQQDHNCEVAL